MTKPREKSQFGCVSVSIRQQGITHIGKDAPLVFHAQQLRCIQQENIKRDSLNKMHAVPQNFFVTTQYRLKMAAFMNAKLTI
ncbi:MAG TPA: hypothetical protein PKX95_01645 [Limnohabitans sp.]|nr:hypothetical protein [Limnohabitans sp.]